MKRSAPLQRRTPIKPGKGFARPQIERKAQPLYKLARPCSAAVVSTLSVSIQKEDVVRSETYRRIVASLPCMYCGIEGFTQHAHGNTGKGAGMKTDDRFAFPLCAARPGEMGCHARFDQGALFPKSVRRDIEIEWARRTVQYVIASDLWPRGLQVPDWAAA